MCVCVSPMQVSVSITLDPKKVSDISQELEALEKELRKLATVSHRQNLAIVSLICNVKRTSSILEKVSLVTVCVRVSPESRPAHALYGMLERQLVSALQRSLRPWLPLVLTT